MKCARCGRELKRSSVTMADGSVMGPKCAKLAEAYALRLNSPRVTEDELFAWLDEREAWQEVASRVVECHLPAPQGICQRERQPWWQRLWAWIKWRVTVSGGFG